MAVVDDGLWSMLSMAEVVNSRRFEYKHLYLTQSSEQS